MKRTFRAALAATFLLLVGAMAWAQPQRGGQGMPGGRMGGGMGMPVEMVLGQLALDPEIELSDEQLLQLRASLRDLYQEQAQMREDTRSGDVDFRQMREIMAGFREDLTAALSAVLTEDQLGKYEEAVKNARQSMGQRPRRRRN